MLDESILWTRAIEPTTGRIEKRDTFLGAVLKIVGGAVFLGAVVYAVILIGSVWQYVTR
jgi:hypothetical protein